LELIGMPLNSILKISPKGAIVAIWLILTLALAFFFPGLSNDDGILFGMPWIVVIAIICQALLFGLFVFISRYIWTDGKEGSD